MDPNVIKAEIAALEAKRKRLVNERNSIKNDLKKLDQEIDDIETVQRKLNQEIEAALAVVDKKLAALSVTGTLFALLFKERSKKIIIGKEMTSALENLSTAKRKATEQNNALYRSLKNCEKKIADIDRNIQDLRRQLNACAQAEQASSSN